jgi:hypothetical protein
VSKAVPATGEASLTSSSEFIEFPVTARYACMFQIVEFFISHPKPKLLDDKVE